jgi:signal transduction histidine kinase
VEQRDGQFRAERDLDDLLGFTAGPPAGQEDPRARRRRQVGHDLQHGLATVAILAEAVAVSRGLEQEAVERLRHLQSEVRRLQVLLDEEFQGDALAEPDAPVRVDLLVREVCSVAADTTTVPVDVVTEPVHVVVNLNGLWRVLSNVLDNAIRAAEGRGGIQARVFARDGRAVIEVDDSGPGFGLASSGLASVGLGIVQDFVARYDGTLEIGEGSLGGCCVRLSLVAQPLLGLVGPPASSGLGRGPATP